MEESGLQQRFRASVLKNASREEPIWPYSLVAITMLIVLLMDYSTPLGITVWVAYVVPVAVSLWAWRPSTPLVVAAIATFLMVLMYATHVDSVVAIETVRINRLFGVATIWVMAAVSWYSIRYKMAFHLEGWLRAGQTELGETMRGDLRKEQLGENVLRFLAERLNAHVGVIYATDGTAFRRLATYGVTDADVAPEGFRSGDGLLGQAVKDRRPFLVDSVPDGRLTIKSAFLQGPPKDLIVAPAIADGVVNAVLELGFLQPVPMATLEFLDRVSESLGVAVRSARYRSNLQNLLEETQRQTEELQAQGEELRVSNEELSEQGRALKEYQARLENQHAELEQTNLMLEEQTQLLEAQRDDLSRTKSELQLRARELEQASQYKTNFLANMSHELRTPLNSSLILAKLLADNPQGNLTSEQVRFAETIQSAGNDLLTLINDILDLSKIEAGRMDVRPEPFSPADLVSGLSRSFEPLAAQKRLVFRTEAAVGVPDVVHSDRQRLEQVLKNLLANAIKFTERGEVSLTASSTADGRVAFAVADTGIGIPGDQQSAIFEAFRQADGTPDRKYGGTGLGLSISRELVRLLAGEIQVSSEPGRGSVFTVIIPATYDPVLVPPRFPSGPPPPLDFGESRLSSFAEPDAPAARTPVSPHTPGFLDDRDRLDGKSRVILIVEDDETFARILYDLAHELNFQCLVAGTAELALAAAREYSPSAVVLDVGLPDQSGLSVLDRLKHDARTRHIPVHVVSANDHSQTALALGAIGYALKPVKREELAQTLKQLGRRLERDMRRVLVVEDDPVQLDSLRALLGSLEVETVGARTGAECLELLRATTFDCMVLDLSLPDASGYSLLETLSREDSYSFPPVIVYTGRDLSREEEETLRKYSRSIIIKGAKSPERLLDEVTLFLHQVVSELAPEHQRMLEKARSRDAALEGRRILIVEDDVRNVFALTSVLEPRGAIVQIARNGREALDALEHASRLKEQRIDLVLMDVMMPEMDGLAATQAIRSRAEWKKLPVIMLTAKAMKDDQEQCLAAGANDYVAKPLDVEKLLSLVRVWMPR